MSQPTETELPPLFAVQGYGVDYPISITSEGADFTGAALFAEVKDEAGTLIGVLRGTGYVCLEGELRASLMPEGGVTIGWPVGSYRSQLCGVNVPGMGQPVDYGFFPVYVRAKLTDPAHFD